MNNKRRTFLIASSLGIGAMCVGIYNSHSTKGSFEHGVASGDPLADSVILWTRVTPLEEDDKDIKLTYDIALDKSFSKLICSKEVLFAKKENDFTVKIDVKNLSQGTTYFYRFKIGDTFSPIGKTKTLTSGNLDSVKLAVFSCANYQHGYFNAYEEAAKHDDIDALIHLGDYIYESGADIFRKNSRKLPVGKDHELFTLDDYRKRYALYRSDAGLQALHASAAMICVWDDHEVSNGSYKNSDELYKKRKLSAMQAYFEWLPIRSPFSENPEIFRAFHFGDLLSLHMLDTRHFGREKPLELSFYESIDASYDEILKDIKEPQREMLGATQQQWLEDSIKNSNASWQVLGQQVLMGRMYMPTELLNYVTQLGSRNDQAFYMKAGTNLYEVYKLKQRAMEKDTTLTEKELDRLSRTLPYNLEAWDGYENQRERIYQNILKQNKNLLVISGDSHNAWANELKALDENSKPTIAVGVEFATPSVTSDGMEVYAKVQDNERAKMLEKAAVKIVDELQYLNANNRGFMIVTLTHEAAEAEWIFVDTVKSKNYTPLATRSKKLKTFTGSKSISNS